ncbi:MAG: ArsA family ATPase [Bacillota bacterium]|nr:ArsA family ATPase [Bacillota bacterium]MDI7250277.1 ArsA family ATPase [Bacillota bacterium]
MAASATRGTVRENARQVSFIPAEELVRESLLAFTQNHPQLKYVFFGGKGGVGKTVMAGAAALWYARQGRRTLLASTNPVHSLSALLGQNVFGAERQVAGVPGLYAYEIDTADTIKRSKEEIREKIRWFLKYADIPTESDAFVETATMNPSFEESAMFENMINIMFEDKYEVYVFDTAPTANARRLLGMSKVYSLWVEKMVESRKEAQAMRLALSFRKRQEKDPLMDYLISFRGRIGQANRLLTDASRTAFYFVTLPEALPIAVIRRFIGWFHDFGIPVGGVVVNGVIDPGVISASTSEFVLNRVMMQQEYLAQIRDLFPDVRAVVPLFETEVQGLKMLERVAEVLFR